MKARIARRIGRRLGSRGQARQERDRGIWRRLADLESPQILYDRPTKSEGNFSVAIRFDGVGDHDSMSEEDAHRIAKTLAREHPSKRFVVLEGVMEYSVAVNAEPVTNKPTKTDGKENQ